MKTSQKAMPTGRQGFALLTILLIVAGVLVVSGAGYWWYQNQILNPTTQAGTTKQDVSVCGDFDALSLFVLNNIEKPDSQNVIGMNKSVIPSFLWKRNANEPFISYPIIKGISAYYGDQKTYRSNDFLMSAIKNDSNLISPVINEEARVLGLIPDQLNTLPFKSFPLPASEMTGLEQKDSSYLQVFAFRKNDDLYSVILEAEKGHGAQGQGVVKITCGKVVEQYDKVYSALNFKADSSVKNAYSKDYVAIADISPDATTYALIGSSNQVKIADYYHFSGDIFKLMSENSYPADCAVLESQKVGEGMRCSDGPPNYAQREVTY